MVHLQGKDLILAPGNLAPGLFGPASLAGKSIALEDQGPQFGPIVSGIAGQSDAFRGATSMLGSAVGDHISGNIATVLPDRAERYFSTALI